MSREPTLKYFGWSSFSFESGNGAILFAPLYRNLFGRAWSPLDALRRAKVSRVTHAPFYQYVAVPAVQKETDAIGVSSHTVCKHLNTKYKGRREWVL